MSITKPTLICKLHFVLTVTIINFTNEHSIVALTFQARGQGFLFSEVVCKRVNEFRYVIKQQGKDVFTNGHSVFTGSLALKNLKPV